MIPNVHVRTLGLHPYALVQLTSATTATAEIGAVDAMNRAEVRDMVRTMRSSARMVAREARRLRRAARKEARS